MAQISNYVFCEDFLTKIDIPTGILPNPYYDYPFLIIKNFLSNKVCREITSNMKTNKDIYEAKIRKKDGLRIKADTNTKIRKTKIHKLSTIHKRIYAKSFIKHQKDIEKFFNLAITTSTQIQALEYTKGSFYKQHSDDSSVLVKNEKIIGFLPVAAQRKISTVLFTTTNSDIVSDNTFNGGELIFNYLSDKEGHTIQIKPKAGDMLVFLSNPYFTHEVLEVGQGYRVSLVQWHDAII